MSLEKDLPQEKRLMVQSNVKRRAFPLDIRWKSPVQEDLVRPISQNTVDHPRTSPASLSGFLQG